jgi:hypothetical protein
MNKPSLSYREAAAAVAAVGTAPAAPPTHACAAYGCPLSAGLIREGRRLCCVHFDVGSWDNYAAATTVIRERIDLVEAIALLRSPGFRIGRQVVDDACAICSDLDPTLSRYDLLQQAEGLLRRLALTGSDAIYRPGESSVMDSVVGQVGRLALEHRMPS